MTLQKLVQGHKNLAQTAGKIFFFGTDDAAIHQAERSGMLTHNAPTGLLRTRVYAHDHIGCLFMNLIETRGTARHRLVSFDAMPGKFRYIRQFKDIIHHFYH